MALGPSGSNGLELHRLATVAGRRSISAMSSIHVHIVKVGSISGYLNAGYKADEVPESHLDCVYQGNYRERESGRSARYVSELFIGIPLCDVSDSPLDSFWIHLTTQ